MILYGRLKFTPRWGKIVIKISHLLLTASSALNIIIYSYKVMIRAGAGIGGVIKALFEYHLVT